MKKYPVLLISALLAIAGACSQNTTEPTFTISGQIKNPKSGKILLVQEEDINRKKTKFVDEIKPDANGSFSMEFDLEPHIYAIDLYGEGRVRLAIDKGQKLVVEADARDLKNVKVSGSEDTEKLEAYEKTRRESLERLVISVRDKLKSTGDYNNTGAEEAGLAEVTSYEKHKEELNAFIKNNMRDSIALYATTLRWDDQNIPFFESLVDSFEKKHGDLAITKRLNEKIEILKATSVGGKAASIEMPDKDGKQTALDTSKVKYTLVDFWASWCGPCRRESKKLGTLLEEYHSKGFAIYSISLDSDRDKWLAAQKQDGRTWTDVSTLRGLETPAAFDYGVTALPAKFLIDSEGKIVAKNLNGKELEEKLRELF